MFYIGIDIAKRSHQAAVTNASGELIVKPFSFKNSAIGFAQFLSVLEENSVAYSCCVIGLEATGHYWYPLYFFLIEQKFTVKVFNPIQTAAFREIAIRKVKNDNHDSIMIADFTRFGRYSETYIPSEAMLALKNLSRFRLSVSDLCSDLKRRTLVLLDQIFPEYSSVFSDTFGTTSKQLLEKYSTPDEFSEISTTKLANFIHKISRGRFGREKAELIKNGGEKAISAILPILDDLERALQNMQKADDVKAMYEGIDLIHQKFLKNLGHEGLEKMNPVGEAFDTDFHEAIALVPAPEEAQKGKVLDCVQTGYKLNDKVIRHAKVVVAQ